MAKSSAKQIEQDKKRILDELTKNAHRSVNEIADTLGFSRQKVWRIIKNLEEDKTIWGYTAIVDDNKMGRKKFCVLLKKAFIEVPDEKLNIVISRELRKIAEKNGVYLESTYFFNGQYDGQICVIAEDLIHVKKFLAAMVEKLGEAYFKEIKLLEVLVPIQMRGFNNPNLKQLKEYFLSD